MMIRSLVLAAAAAVLAAAGSPAAAHPRLITATPAINGVVAATSTIALEFSERLIGQFSGVTITRAGGTVAAPASAVKTMTGSDGRTLVAHLRSPLTAGRYILAWHAVSTDTHRVAGSYRFTIR